MNSYQNGYLKEQLMEQEIESSLAESVAQETKVPILKQKASPKSNRVLSVDDLSRIEEALREIPLTEIQEKIRAAIAGSEDLREGFLFREGPKANLGVLYASMNIVNRWKQKVSEDGTVIGEPEGNLDDPNELDRDATRLSALNISLSTIKGQIEAATSAAEQELTFTEANLRNTVRKEKRKIFQGNPTEKELSDIVITNAKYREAYEIFASCRELSLVITAVYFSIRNLEERLNNRVRSLISHWGRTVNRG